MSEETTTKVVVSESPASWNTRYITPDGFTCQFTLRAENGKELIERANSALDFLREQGCIPFFGYQRDNGNQRETKEMSDSNNESSWCSLHEQELKRWQKNGKVWYSHKTPEGWCYGKSNGE